MDNSFQINRKKRRVAYYGDQVQFSSRTEGLPGGVTTEAQDNRHSPFPRQGYPGHHGSRCQYVCNSSSMPPQAPPPHRYGAMEDPLRRVSSYHGRPIPPPPPPPRPPPIPPGPSSNSYRKEKSIAIKINKDLLRSHSPQDVIAVVKKANMEMFDGVNVSTALHRLASFEQIDVRRATHSPEFVLLVSSIPMKISTMAVRNISNVMWAFAKLHPGYQVDASILDILARAMHLQLEMKKEVLPQNLSNALWAMANLNYAPRCPLLPTIEKGVRELIARFSPQNLSNTVLSFAKLGYYPSESTIKIVLDGIRKSIDAFGAQALSNTVWGLSKMGIKDPEVYDIISAASLGKISSFTPQNLSLSLWGFANIGYNPGQRELTVYADAGCERIEQFSAQNISNIVWSLAKFTIDHPLYDLAATQAASLPEEFSPQTCSNLIWSFACIKKDIPNELLSSIFLKLPASFEQWAPQNLTNIVWGLAVLKQEHASAADLVSRVNHEIFSRLASPNISKTFTSQNLSNYFWALGLQNESMEHCKQFEGIFLSRIHEFLPQEIASICVTCARLDYFSSIMMDKIAEIVVSNIKQFEGQNMSNVVWSCGKLRYLNIKLFTSISLAAEAKLATFSSQDISNILWAFAVLTFEVDLFYSLFVEEIIHRMSVGEQVNPSQISNIIWALSISNRMDEATWNALIQYIHFDSLDNAKVEICSQIFQSHLILRARNGSKVFAEIPGYARVACEETWKTVTKKVTVSDFHLKVSHTLNTMGEKHVVEYLTEDENFSIDIAFPLEKIAMEIDGPKHFTRANDPLGDTRARDDLLRARGWHVVSIPYFAWALDTETQKRLLERALGNVRGEVISKGK